MKVCTKHEFIKENSKVCVRDPVCRAIRERTSTCTLYTVTINVKFSLFLLIKTPSNRTNPNN